MQTLKITLIQTSLFWEDPVANRSMLEEKIWQTEEADLVILPEMFTTGFSMNAPELAEHMNFTTTRWLKQMAMQKKACIAGSIIVEEEKRFFNRLLWVDQEGNVDCYDKRHLFRMAGEENVYSPGEKLLIKEIKEWKICPLICYDLRFPIWSRNVDNQYDLLIYVAEWPASRQQAWRCLLPARAVENLAYVAGINRVGTDGNNIDYAGDSGVWNFKGNCLLDMKDHQDFKTITLDKEDLENFRKKFPAWMDGDHFTILPEKPD